MIRVLFVLILFLIPSGRVEAQEVSPFVKYGKWALLAGSIGMNYLGIHSHNQADDAFDTLEAQCTVDQERCALNSEGTYADPAIEELYQTSLDYDQSARLWLIAAETALVGPAVLFVWELTLPKPRPDNIPFEPEVRSLRGGGTGLGLRFGF
jgi:hypothetical protein